MQPSSNSRFTTLFRSSSRLLTAGASVILLTPSPPRRARSCAGLRIRRGHAGPNDGPLNTKSFVSGERFEHFGQLSGAFQRSAFNFYCLGLHVVHLLVVYAHMIVHLAHFVKGNFTKKLTILTFNVILQIIGGEENARQS